MVMTVDSKLGKERKLYENGLMGTSSLVRGVYILEQYNRPLKSAINDNRYAAVVTTATNNFMKRIEDKAEETNDYGDTLAMSEYTQGLDNNSAASSRNHFLAMVNEIKENKDIDSPEAVKLFINEVKARNAADVLVNGRAEGYALESLDYVLGFLENLGKGDASKGIEALQTGKVPEDKIENCASIAAEKSALSKEMANELVMQFNRDTSFKNLPPALAVHQFNSMVNNHLLNPDVVNKVLEQLDSKTVEKVTQGKTPEEGRIKTYMRDTETGIYSNKTSITDIAQEGIKDNAIKEYDEKKKEELAKAVIIKNISKDRIEAEHRDNRTGTMIKVPLN